MQDLTLSEKVAICGLVCGVVDNWADCYLIGAGKYGDLSVNRNNLRPTVSRWKNSAKVVKEYEKQMAELATRAKGNLTISDNLGEGEKLISYDNKEHTENGRKRAIDYNDPQERKRAYNRIISESADDPKTQLDALKVFEQLQRDDKQAAKDNQIQRFYSPLRCSSCPLYQKANKNLTI